MSSRDVIVDGAACVECCPGVPGTWHVEAEIVEGIVRTVHRCNNCRAVRIPRKVTKTLPEKPTAEDLTPSQRRRLAIIREVYTDGTIRLDGCGRKVFVSYVGPWSSRMWEIGPRGGSEIIA